MRKINDIFYSLQGEGFHTGRPAVFIRFAGCNLRCPFCDTSFDDFREMTDDDILASACAYPARFVVLTGGEPSLQTDDELIARLHAAGFEVAMESNGTHRVPSALDWLTVSPKRPWHQGAENIPGRPIDELKVIFDGNAHPNDFLPPTMPHPAPRLLLQPCDTGDARRNSLIIHQCIDYIKAHPQWRLSLQTHKLAGFK